MPSAKIKLKKPEKKKTASKKKAVKIVLKVSPARKIPVKIQPQTTVGAFSFFVRPAVKITSLFLLVAMNWYSLAAVGNTLAYLSDIEESRNNSFGATDLDLSLNFLRSDGFRSQTQGGWGARARGNNPAAYRDKNFDAAFPAGLTIGLPEGFSAHFASSSKIEDFLPAGGTASPFTTNHDNPLTTEAGVLAGQTVALTLNLVFDEFDPDFGVNESLLKDFKANSAGSPCEDLTAGEVLAEANKVLAGLASDFTPSEINECADEINNKFDNGLAKKITPTLNVWREININKQGELNFQHNLKIEPVSGDAEFCQALTLNAWYNGAEVYTGNLLSFTSASEIFNDPAGWRLFIGLPAGAPLALKNKTCGLKYIIKGWQENLSQPDDGFSDTEEIEDLIKSGSWELGVVMNEFLPNPEGEDYGFNFGADESLMPQGEWIELYNNGSIQKNLAGWYFKDAGGTRIDITDANISASSTVIAAHDWLVVYLNQAMLDNAGAETISLYDNHDNLIDFYGYSGNDYCDLQPTPDGENADNPAGACAGVPPNKSYARLPDGIGNWTDPVPTPGQKNVLEFVPVELEILSDILLDASLGTTTAAAENNDIIEPAEPVAEDIASTSATTAEETAETPADPSTSETVTPDETAADTPSTEGTGATGTVSVPPTEETADQAPESGSVELINQEITIDEPAADTTDPAEEIAGTEPVISEEPAVIEQAPAEEVQSAPEPESAPAPAEEPAPAPIPSPEPEPAIISTSE